MTTIYLDWNRFAALKDVYRNVNSKEFDKEKKFRDIILMLRRWYGYYFPYSTAHIFDIKKESSKEYWATDFSFLAMMSDCIKLEDEKTNVKDPFEESLAYSLPSELIKNMTEVIEEFERIKRKPGISQIEVQLIERKLQEKISIDMTKEWTFSNEIPSELKPYFLKYEGDYIGYLKYLIKIADEELYGNNFLKLLRSLRMQKQQGVFGGKTPMGKYLKDKEVKHDLFLEALLSQTKTVNDMDVDGFITIAFAVLAFRDEFLEKVKPKNNTINVLADAIHFRYAITSEYFVTEDSAFLKKAIFLKDLFTNHLGFTIQTKMVNTEYFTNYFQLLFAKSEERRNASGASK